jgi:hypothetical protein
MLTIECAKLRRSGQSDAALIEAEPPISIRTGGATTRLEKSRFFYFLGACLRKRDPDVARRYFKQAVRENPWFLRALARSILG